MAEKSKFKLLLVDLGNDRYALRIEDKKREEGIQVVVDIEGVDCREGIIRQLSGAVRVLQRVEENEVVKSRNEAGTYSNGG